MTTFTPAIESKISPNSLWNLMAYEEGNLEDDEVINLFQELIDTGLLYSLQGTYGRTAQQLIDAGYCFAN